jgi:hypothetical protein
MSKLPWTPWHKVVKIRDDLKSGELSLAVFAADLYDVTIEFISIKPSLAMASGVSESYAAHSRLP